MIETNYICDYCGKVAKEQIPEGWYILGFTIVRYMKPNADYKIKNPPRLDNKWQETHHFCGDECLNLAVNVRKPKEDKQP